jgi:hypothetical protein
MMRTIIVTSRNKAVHRRLGNAEKHRNFGVGLIPDYARDLSDPFLRSLISSVFQRVLLRASVCLRVRFVPIRAYPRKPAANGFPVTRDFGGFKQFAIDTSIPSSSR